MSGMMSRALLMQGDPAHWALDIEERVAAYLPQFKIGGRDVLVGVWVPGKDNRTTGGIILPDGVRDESRFQGVTGLILKMGPSAYKTETTERWFLDADGNPDPPRVGEWVSFNFKQGEPFLLLGQPCRLVDCQHILLRIPRPDLVA